MNYYKLCLALINLFGDWGLGIGDCPIPNPQSPIPIYTNILTIILKIN